jgi:hypothetical protein
VLGPLVVYSYPNLISALHGVLKALKTLQNKPKGFRWLLNEIINSRGIVNEINGYSNKICELRLNIMASQLI